MPILAPSIINKSKWTKRYVLFSCIPVKATILNNGHLFASSTHCDNVLRIVIILFSIISAEQFLQSSLSIIYRGVCSKSICSPFSNTKVLKTGCFFINSFIPFSNSLIVYSVTIS